MQAYNKLFYRTTSTKSLQMADKKTLEGKREVMARLSFKRVKTATIMYDVVIGRILALAPKPNCRLIPPANSFNSCK